MHFLIGLPGGIEWFLALAAAIGALFILGRKVWRWCKRTGSQWDMMVDSLTGFEELIDPATGIIVREQLPGISQRVSVIEHWQTEAIPLMTRLTEAIERLADVEERLDHIEKRLDEPSN